MMLFKLSLKNIRKSFKDYSIYFLTLILGVAIFYVFNTIDSQTAMMRLSESTREIVKLLLQLLSGVSVCVAFILGFLIVYASNFLIKRRKKEFGIYMLLGMEKREISRILLGETMLIGVLSLFTGLCVGIFGSQFMSILVAKMFEADMSAYTFVFSKAAMIKTILYFGIMYVIVMLFNAFTISKYKLIDLFQAAGKNEKGKLKSSALAVVLFVISCGILIYAYNQVAFHTGELGREDTLLMILLGIIGTFGVFWSLSGFLLKLLQRFKGFYQRGLTAFVLRQVNSNINTAVFSMTIICLLFFVTITVLSAGLSINYSLKQELKSHCPVDLNLMKPMDIPGDVSNPEVEYSKLTVEEALMESGFDLSLLAPDYEEVTVYYNPELTYMSFFGDMGEQAAEKYPMVNWKVPEDIMSNSDYNRMAVLYGIPQLQVEEGKYLMVCNFTSMVKLRNERLLGANPVTIGETTLIQQENHCVDGYITINIQDANQGILVVPDSVVEKYAGTELLRGENVFVADYAAETEQEKKATEEKFMDFCEQAIAKQPLLENLEGITKIFLYESSVGLSAVITFIAIYLGIVFLIAGAALLALKELSESTVNKTRYMILDKIGVDEKQKHRALLWQMGIFFGLPMVLAMIHSVFGILYASHLLSMYGMKDMLASLVFTGVFLLIVYGGYFAATYFGSRRIIDER